MVYKHRLCNSWRHVLQFDASKISIKYFWYTSVSSCRAVQYILTKKLTCWSVQNYVILFLHQIVFIDRLNRALLAQHTVSQDSGSQQRLCRYIPLTCPLPAGFPLTPRAAFFSYSDYTRFNAQHDRSYSIYGETKIGQLHSNNLKESILLMTHWPHCR